MVKLFFILCFVVLVFISSSFSQSINDDGVLLYSQTDNDGSWSIASYYYNSNDWEQVVDDFIVTSNWEIAQIVIIGMDPDPSYSGFNIYIYSDNSGSPGTLVYSAETQPFTISYINYFYGYITINLAIPANLSPGDYFISVQSFIVGNSNSVLLWSQVNGAYGNIAMRRHWGGDSLWVSVNFGVEINTDMSFELYGIAASATGIAEDEVNPPLTFELEQNYPNPFNPSTKISWQSPVAGHQSIKVYDVLGNEIATLINEEKPAGNYEVEFNASNLSSGTYFYQIKVGSFIETKKMILMK